MSRPRFLADNDLIVVSHDVNTMPAAALARISANQRMTGLLMARQNAAVGPLIDSLVLIWSASEAEEWLDQILFLPL